MILNTLFIIFFFIVVVFAFTKPQYAVYALVFFLSSFGIKSIPIISQYHLSLVLSVIVFIGVFTHPRHRDIPFFDKQIALLSILCLPMLLSIAVAYDQTVAINQVFEYAKPILLYLMLIRALEDERDIQRLVLLLVLIGVANSFLSIHQVVTGNSVRGVGTVGDPNVLAMLLAGLVPLSLFYFTAENRIVIRLFGLASAFLISFGTIYTYSRGAFVAMVVVWGLYLITTFRRKTAVVLVTIFFIGIAIHYIPERYEQRIQTISLDPQEESAAARLAIYLAGLQLLSDNWLMGVGIGNFRYQIISYLPHDLKPSSTTPQKAAHNLYLEFACETGIIGILILLAFLFRKFVANLRVSRQIKSWPDYPLSNMPQFIQFSLIGILIATFFLSEFENPIVWVVLALPPIMERVTAATAREVREKKLEVRPTAQRMRNVLAAEEAT